MLALPRLRNTAQDMGIAKKPRSRGLLRAGVLVPLLFLIFSAWGALMSFPALQALLLGVRISDSIATMEHGEKMLRPVWAAALPGLSLAAIGVLGALWSSRQYRTPEPEFDGAAES